MSYEHLDISGDAGVRVWGDTLEEVFKDTALGMYDLITDMEKIKGRSSVNVELKSHSIEGLLVGWLNELIYRFDTIGFVGKNVVVEEFGYNHIVATVEGEDFDSERHERGVLPKAATYHGLKVEQLDDKWQAEVIFDI
jgi:SHS2 domain-containing protein